MRIKIRYDCGFGARGSIVTVPAPDGERVCRAGYAYRVPPGEPAGLPEVTPASPEAPPASPEAPPASPEAPPAPPEAPAASPEAPAASPEAPVAPPAPPAKKRKR